MTSKTLYANGCSFVWGDELYSDNKGWKELKNKEQRWSRKFSESYEFNEVNESLNGSSNDRIFRTTKDWILDNQGKLENTFVVIGWSQPERTEWYNDIAKRYEAINYGVDPTEMSCKDGIDATGRVQDGLTKWEDKSYGPFLGKCPSSKFWKDYQKYYYNDDYYIDQTILKMLGLKSILDFFNVKYYFYSSMTVELIQEIFVSKYRKLFDLDKICHDTKEKWISKIVKDETNGDIYFDPEENSWVNPNGGWTGFSGSHPDQKSHKLWSEFLYKEYKGLYSE